MSIPTCEQTIGSINSRKGSLLTGWSDNHPTSILVCEVVTVFPFNFCAALFGTIWPTGEGKHVWGREKVLVRADTATRRSTSRIDSAFQGQIDIELGGRDDDLFRFKSSEDQSAIRDSWETD